MYIRHDAHTLDLTEENNRPLNWAKYLEHKRFHDSQKGCDIEMIIKKTSDGRGLMINRICKTHNINCSKTGWEIGWYLGKNSKLGLYTAICCDCGKETRTKAINFKRCSACAVKASNKRAGIRWKSLSK